MRVVYFIIVLVSFIYSKEEFFINPISNIKIEFRSFYKTIDDEFYWKELKAYYPNKKEKVLVRVLNERGVGYIDVIKSIGDVWSKDGKYFMYGVNLSPNIKNNQTFISCAIVNVYGENNFFVNINDLEDEPNLGSCKVDWDLKMKHTLIYNELLEFGRNGKKDKFRTIFYRPIIDVFNDRYNAFSKNIKAKDELFSFKDINIFFKHIPIVKKNLTIYNNIAYYLQKANANEEAVYLLEKILVKFPNRTVAHYNLADAYWALGEKKKAVASYKIYIQQMKAKGKHKRIPKVVRDRVLKK